MAHPDSREKDVNPQGHSHRRVKATLGRQRDQNKGNRSAGDAVIWSGIFVCDLTKLA